MLPYEKALIIIPTYNEKENVQRMVETIFQVDPRFSVLIIDDNSPDGTAHIVKNLQRQHSHLHLLERPGKQGLGTAYISGFKWALAREQFEFIFEMDCDFSHDPQALPLLLEAAQRADLIIGSRYTQGIRIINWPMKRLLLSFCASLYIRLMTALPLHDATGGFKCFTRKSLLQLNLDDVRSNGFAFQIELNYKIWNKGLSIEEVPIIFYERKWGHSKMHRGIIFEALFLVLNLRWKKLCGTL